MASAPLIINGRAMLTSHEAAHLSGWSQNYLGVLCRKGIIAGVRTSTLWLIDEEALLARIKERKSKAELRERLREQRRTTPLCG